MAKRAASQFAQRWRQIAPSIGVSDWVERNRKSLPSSISEEYGDTAPIENCQGKRSIKFRQGFFGIELKRFAVCDAFGRSPKCPPTAELTITNRTTNRCPRVRRYN